MIKFWRFYPKKKNIYIYIYIFKGIHPFDNVTAKITSCRKGKK